MGFGSLASIQDVIWLGAARRRRDFILGLYVKINEREEIQNECVFFSHHCSSTFKEDEK